MKRRKLKYKTKRMIQGSISVLLIIVLVPMMLFSSLMVDYSRINMAQAMVSGAGNLALNSALADYDTIVKDVYGLFVMSQNKTEDELKDEIEKYFEKTVVSYGVVEEADAKSYVQSLVSDFSAYINSVSGDTMENFLDMEFEGDFTVNRLPQSSLANPDIMRKEIVDYMKLRGPVSFGLSFFDSIKAFSSVSEQGKVISSQVAAQESLQEVTNGCKVAIDAIRAYDDELNKIQFGELVVKGRDSYDDGQIIAVEDPDTHQGYRDQVLRYREEDGSVAWSDTIRDANLLTIIYLLNAPETKDCYCVKLSEFVKSGGNGIVTDKCGISGSGSKTGSNSEKYYAQKNDLLAKVGDANGYPGVSVEDAFVPASNLSGTSFAEGARDSAISSFIAYEKFLKNDASAIYTYDKAKDVLENIYLFDKYYQPYHNDLVSEENKKYTEKEKANKERADAQADYDAQDAKADAAHDEYEAAKKESPPDPAKISSLQAAYNAESQKLPPLAATLAEKNNAFSEAQEAYNTAVTNRTNLENEYKDTLSKFVTFSQKYIDDIKQYNAYIAAAESTVTTNVSHITEQFGKINTNILDLSQRLGEIRLTLDNILDEVKTYEGKIDDWVDMNSAYVASQGEDSFSKQSETEVDASKINISEDTVSNLINYIGCIDAEYQELYEAITTEGNGNFYYGTKKYYDISDLGDFKKLTKKSITDNEKILTKEDASASFDSLAKKNTTPMVFNDLGINLSLLGGDAESSLSFLKYLNSTFPKEASTEVDDETGKTDKEKYDDLKKDLKEKNNGGAITDDTNYASEYSGTSETPVEATSFGYTYKSHNMDGQPDLPSSGTGTSSSSATKLKIDEEGNQIKAAESLKGQTDAVSGILGGLGNVASTGLENIYILDYIFENFSYNTCAQECILDGEEIKNKEAPTLADALVCFSSAETINKYKDKNLMLSKIPINAENNYLYGAEVEYMLYGKPTAADNVSSAKASIYAIRTVFNSVYAFTNSEIRNSTRSVGLAVQAATCGVVPYQLVQVVLQLALAMAESAVDLTALSNGLKVAIVKTEDTWTLSLSNATKLAGDYISSVASEYAASAIETAGAALQKVIDAGADELKDAAGSLAEDLGNAVESGINDLVGNALSALETKIELALGDLGEFDFNRVDFSSGVVKFNPLSKTETLSFVDGKFEEVKAGFAAEVDTIFAGTAFDDPTLKGAIVSYANDACDIVKNKVHSEIELRYEISTDSFAGNNVSEIVFDVMNDAKEELLAKIADGIHYASISARVEFFGVQIVTEAAESLDEYIALSTEETSEAVAENIKNGISEYTNEFIDKYIPGNKASSMGDGLSSSGSTSKSVASIIKFGYKDYLMLFSFIKLCSTEGCDTMLLRMADLMQVNICNASKSAGASYEHKKGTEFRIADARTYVAISGTIDLDLLLLDISYFNEMFKKIDDDMETSMDKYGKIKYFGLQGY